VDIALTDEQLLNSMSCSPPAAAAGDRYAPAAMQSVER